MSVYSGFVLSFISFYLLLDKNWILVYIGNALIVYILGLIITMQFLVRFASIDGLGKIMIIAFSGGQIAFIIRIIIK